LGRLLKKPVRDILFVTVGYTLGGSENMIARIAPLLRNRGYKVRVLAFKGWGPVSEKLTNEGIECIALFGRGKFNIRVLWRYFLYLRQYPPDVIIAFLYRAYIPSRIFGALLNIPNVSSVRGVRVKMSLMQRTLDRITAPLCDVVYSCSEAVTEFLIRNVRIKKEHIVTIPNGIDVKSFSIKVNRKKKSEELGLDSRTKVVGTVSRLHEPTKGIKILLEASRIVQREVDSQLLIVGSGKDENLLKNTVKNLGINALFLGERKDVAEILKVMDLFVLPSLSEGFPVVLLEAMAAGLPVIATDVGGNKEVVLDSKTGFIVEPDNPDKLAEFIRKVLVDDDIRNKFSKEGYKRIKEKFSIAKTVDEIENLWKGDLK
jgi:glycosyltransferase involved in cell wall biosynthesis